jgi:toxin ParE1/3/4
MAEVGWTPLAEEDLEGIAYYIGKKQHRPETARQLVDGVVEKCQRYAEQPALGARLKPDKPDDLLRFFRYKRYAIVYQTITDGIEVIRVLDGSRDFSALFRL